MASLVKNRIGSIDLLRGFVMVLMALDHVRDYFHYDAFQFDPTDLTQTNLALFFTRFITHFCAPVFVFLAGTSAFFVGQRLDKKSLSIWLLKRGVWLIFAEITIIKLAWFFQLNYGTILLMVIWVLGASMIFLAGFIHFPKKIMIILSLLAIAGHNAFDHFNPTGGLTSDAWTLLHNAFNTIDFANFKLFVAYPLIPWIFVMPLGYYFGELYLPSVQAELRIKRLLWLGFGLTATFILLRVINVYGDPYAWTLQSSLSFTIMSFFNLTKYPPSLLYLLVTLGPSFIFLAFAEKWKGKIMDALTIIGKVPMFYYIVHLYLIHLMALAAAVLTGFRASDMIVDFWVTLQPELKGYGFNLGIVYVLWIALVMSLYPACNWYNTYKSNNRDKWWLSYL